LKKNMGATFDADGVRVRTTVNRITPPSR